MFLLLGLVSSVVAAPISAAGVLVYLIQASRNRRAGVSLFSLDILACGANLVLFRPDLLNEDGQQYRRMFFRAVLVFLSTVAASFLFFGGAKLVE
jgi:hypothetical protein